MKYNDNGEWKDVQIKVANAIQNEYGESNNDCYSQNYLNDKVVNVGTEVDEDYRTNIIVQDELFNGTIEQGSIGSSGENISSSERVRTADFISVNSSTNYLIRIIPSTQLFVFEYTENETFVQRVPSDWANADYFNFTTSSTTKKIRIAIKYSNNATITPSAITSLSVKKNIPPSIYVDNEMLISKNVYSTGEVVIGEWLGKPLYRKVVNCGALPNAATKTVAHNISNIDFLMLKGMYATTGNYFISIPSTSVSAINNNVSSSCDKTNIYVAAGNDRSEYTKSYAILEYTKTTDTVSTRNVETRNIVVDDNDDEGEIVRGEET